LACAAAFPAFALVMAVPKPPVTKGKWLEYIERGLVGSKQFLQFTALF